MLPTLSPKSLPTKGGAIITEVLHVLGARVCKFFFWNDGGLLFNKLLKSYFDVLS